MILKHTIYVWVEALCKLFDWYWVWTTECARNVQSLVAADVQVLGKDIIRFHGVYWIALLMAAELPLPKQLLVHGWIKVNEQKMSKSLGNVVDPIALQTTYGC